MLDLSRVTELAKKELVEQLDQYAGTKVTDIHTITLHFDPTLLITSVPGLGQRPDWPDGSVGRRRFPPRSRCDADVADGVGGAAQLPGGQHGLHLQDGDRHHG